MNKNNKVPDDKSPIDSPSIKMYQDIVDRAHTEIEAVRKVYYHFSGLVGVIISIGLVVFSFVSYKNMHEMRADIKEEMELIKAKATQDYFNLASDLKLSTEKTLKS